MDILSDELTPGMTAYSSMVVMQEAKWTDQEGSTVTFKLPMDKTAEEQRNPFHHYTKRRKGKAGTRFMMVCVEKKTQQMIYQDEVMLCGWNDSQTNGHTVKLWLCSDNMGHPFDGFERKVSTFYISLVELDDDNAPIDQKVRERVERTGKRPSERLSYVAAMLCKNEGYHTYCEECDPLGWLEAGGETDPENAARQFILDVLGINSRAELDKSEVLANQFHEDVRRPFLIWKGEY